MGKPYEVPGEGVVEFPDSMSDADIQAVIRRKFAATRQQAMPSRQGNYGEGPPRGFREKAEDVLTRVADSASFGTLPKLSAAIGAIQGKGTYDEVLARRRAEVEAAGERLGTAGTVASDLAGGIASGSALANAGATLVGRLPQNASLAKKILAGAVEGFGYGFGQGAGHTDTGRAQDYLTRGATSGALGAATGGAIPIAATALRRAVTPFPATDPNRAGLVQTLDDAGVRTSAGQRVGSPTLRMMEDTVAKLPLFGRDPARGQMDQVTAAAMARSGVGGRGQATANVLDDGFNTVGGGIGNIQKRYPVDVDNQLTNDVAQIVADHLPILQPGRQGSLQHFIGRLTSGAQITPEMAAATRTQLNRSIKSQNGMNGDKEYQAALIEVKEALDGALERSMVAQGRAGNTQAFQDVQHLGELRQQYANLMTLADGIASSGASGQMGTLTPTALSAAVKRAIGKIGYSRGQGDLNELARASAGILPRPPDSGTSTRESMLDLIKMLYAGPAQLAVNSRLTGAQQYWGNQVMPGPVPPAVLPGAISGAAVGAPAGAQRVEDMFPGLLSP